MLCHTLPKRETVEEIIWMSVLDSQSNTKAPEQESEKFLDITHIIRRSNGECLFHR
jgi:hypothetical protein